MASIALLLRLAIGVIMIHHSQKKLADPRRFTCADVEELLWLFPLLFADATGFAALIGS